MIFIYLFFAIIICVAQLVAYKHELTPKWYTLDEDEDGFLQTLIFLIISTLGSIFVLPLIVFIYFTYKIFNSLFSKIKNKKA